MNISRRNILTLLGAAPLLSVPNLALAAGRRSTKIAYLTDIHLPDDHAINSRALQAFKKAKNCDMFLLGGDNLMAIDNQFEDHIQAQFRNWAKFASNHIRKPYRSIIGNHDIEMGGQTDGTHLCGKRRAMDHFNMKDRYWTEKVGGWRIIGLDTVQKVHNGYYGHVDHEQLGWLESVLTADPHTPTMVMGHVPFLSVTPLADITTKRQKMSTPVSFCSHVSNSREVVRIFREAGNVKLCMSGHTHMNDRCDFAGTTYVCAGSVSGSWWKGPHQGFKPSYTEVDLHADGQFGVKTVHFE